MSVTPPPAGTVEHWAYQLVTTTELSGKLRPAAPPVEWAAQPVALRLPGPGRPSELVPRVGRHKRPRDMRNPKKRAELIHTFLHHELQAAELMAWALLAFADAPAPFRRGLLGICRDEIRHLGLYAEHLETLGHPFGTFPVNDYFWKRVPMEPVSPLHFVARMGIGFEGGNLDHGVRFTAAFAEGGDARAAEIQAQITEEEVAHAAFGLHWYHEFAGAIDFDSWRALLPAPITPTLTRGLPLNLEDRRRAGFPPAFLEALAAWSGDEP